MTTTTPTTDVAVVDPVFSDAERYALAAFLAGYRGLTREAYALDLRQFIAWCEEHRLRLFGVRRADIECFARDLEARGRARFRRATMARRLCTVAGFYRYAEQEDLLDRSPAAHVRRPRLDYESHATGLDRNDVGALLVAAGLASASEHALVSLLAIDGLRISEALGADIEALGLERGHRTLTANRKGGKIVTIPLAPRTARAIDLAIGERLEGPILVGRDGRRLGLPRGPVTSDLWCREVLLEGCASCRGPIPGTSGRTWSGSARNREPGVRIKDIAADFGISESCLTNWLTQADRDEGMRPGPTTDEQAENRGCAGVCGCSSRRTRSYAARRRICPRRTCREMMYPLVRELAGDGIPVTVTCRVLGIARQPYYRWLTAPVSDAELEAAYVANAIFDAHGTTRVRLPVPRR